MARPRIYETPEELQEAINAYFAENPERPTVSGMAVFLGFKSRISMYDYGKRDKYKSVLKDAQLKINTISPQRKLGIKYTSINQYALEKYHKDPITNIKVRIASQIRHRVKNKKRGAIRHLPYTMDELMAHLESKLKKGMNWDNMGKWHIDHIIPSSAFRFTTTDCPEFRQCYALNNLQPMWAKENMKKGSRIVSGSQIYLGL